MSEGTLDDIVRSHAVKSLIRLSLVSNDASNIVLGEYTRHRHRGTYNSVFQQRNVFLIKAFCLATSKIANGNF